MQLKTDRMIARKEGGIGWMIFNSPARRNAVSYEMWQAIPEILGDFATDENVRVVVMRGEGGKAFVSGADISEFGEKRNTAEAVAIYNAAGAKAHEAMLGLQKPLIAMIQGFCIGGGVAVAIDADIRIASDDAQFAIPAAKLGLGYGYDGVKTLMDLVGPSYVKEIFFTAKRFTAAEALQMGLVNRVVPVAQLEATVRDYAETIAANAPMTITTLKATVAEAVKNPEQRDLGKIDRMVADCFASQDYVEGRTAFMEKRKPAFRGR